MVATICTFPRFLLYVFIGARMAPLSDGKQRDEAATHLTIETKLVNGILTIAGILSGAVAGWWVGHLKFVVCH